MPNIPKYQPWSAEESAHLLVAKENFGECWQKIQHYLASQGIHRSKSSCSSRYTRLILKNPLDQKIVDLIPFYISQFEKLYPESKLSAEEEKAVRILSQLKPL